MITGDTENTGGTGGTGNTNTGDISRSFGFVKYHIISDDLAEFLGKEKGSEMSRPDTTKAIHDYIKENDLYDEKLNKAGKMARNRTIIVPDSALKKLLGEPRFPYKIRKFREVYTNCKCCCKCDCNCNCDQTIEIEYVILTVLQKIVILSLIYNIILMLKNASI